LCQNNQYAISVHQSQQMAVENIADRAEGYGFPGVLVDGNDALAVYEVIKEAADRARRGEGPTLVEAKTYRIVPHSSDDDDRTYRSREEVEEWKMRDPILLFNAYLKQESLLSEDQERDLRRRVAKEVDDATDAAEAAPYPPAEQALWPVFAE
jgi:2-oxoisovalerate dehydrogenase E1 component alpha subunit